MGLEEAHADTGDVYYYDHATGKSQWEKPWEHRHKPALTAATTITTNNNSTNNNGKRAQYKKLSGTGGAGYSSSAGFSSAGLPPSSAGLPSSSAVFSSAGLSSSSAGLASSSAGF